MSKADESAMLRSVFRDPTKRTRVPVVVVIVTAAVAIALALNACGGESHDDRALAIADALYSARADSPGSHPRLVSTQHVAGPTWIVRLRVNQGQICVLLDVDKFTGGIRSNSGSQMQEGIVVTRC